MRLVSRDGDAFVVGLSEEELEIINNALNEVCNGVDLDDSEFQTRLGVERATAQDLLTEIHGLFGG